MAICLATGCFFISDKPDYQILAKAYDLLLRDRHPGVYMQVFGMCLKLRN